MNEIEVTPGAGPLRYFLRDFWRRRELLLFFIWRDIKVRYKQSYIGVIWVILKPLLTVLIFTLIYTALGGATIQGIAYPVFIFVGLLFWNFFAIGLQAIVDSLNADQALIQKVYFPRIILPFAALTSVGVDFVVGFSIWIIFAIFFHVSFSLQALVGVLALFCLLYLATAGIGLILMTLNLYARDVSRLLPFTLQLLFFMTPVIYPAQALRGYHALIQFNPFAILLEGSRAILFHSHFNYFTESLILFVGVPAVFLVGIVLAFRCDKSISDTV